MSDSEEINNFANKAGEVFGGILGRVFALGVTSGILFFCWNYGVSQVCQLAEMKYYQSFLFILGWRSLTYSHGK
jgi:hypothetical protein